jgi:hypothetical protein
MRPRTVRGKRVTVRTEDPALQRDGSLAERASSAEFSLRVKPASVRYLLYTQARLGVSKQVDTDVTDFAKGP